MVDVVTWENAHLYGTALISHHRLRYRLFVERQGWDLPSYRGMEYDQFDTPAAIYLLSRGASGQVRGVTRLIPTTYPYMIKELWPGLVGDHDLPSTPEVWEGSRFGVEPELDAATRNHVVAELVLACQEFGLLHGVRQYWVLMPAMIIRRVIGCAGCAHELLGPPQRLGKHRVAVAAVEVSHEALVEARRRSGIHRPVLNIEDFAEEAA
jgi:acyl homoserine lactone synthase